MFAFPVCFLIFINIWIANGLTVTCDENNSCANQQHVYDKTYSNNVTFTCESYLSCDNLIIYFAASKNLLVDCWDESCRNIKVYCGIYDPPGDTYSLSDMDVSSNVNCEVRCDSNTAWNPPPGCSNIYFGCKDNTISDFQCNLNGFSENQIVDSTMECDVQSTLQNECNAYCEEGCINSQLLCHSGSECNSEGTISTFNGVTYAPTKFPTTSPTLTTIAPSKTPTKSPTKFPTISPSTTTPTTMSPTTAVPSTHQPTTAVPTTLTPTTAFPTTFTPTTNLPTTSTPTTIQPTTNNPTTSVPTTAQSTTAQPTTDNPTTNTPTTANTMDVPTTSTEKDAGQVDITINSAAATKDNNAAKSESGINLDNIILYLVASIGILLLVFVCMIVIYICQKRKLKQRQNNILKQDTESINRVDTGMLRVKSASLEMMVTNAHINGSNGNSRQAIMQSENGLSPPSTNDAMGGTLGGVTMGGEDQIINTIANSVNFVDNNDEGTSDDHDVSDEEMYNDPIQNKGTVGGDDDDGSDTPFDAVSPSKGNIVTSMGNM